MAKHGCIRASRFFLGFRYGQDTSRTQPKLGLPKKLEKKKKLKPQISICNLPSLIPSALLPFKAAKQALIEAHWRFYKLMNDLFHPHLVHGFPKRGKDGSVASFVAHRCFYKLIDYLLLSFWLEMNMSSYGWLLWHLLALSSL